MKPSIIQTQIKALSLASHGHDWLAGSFHPRVLHVFDRACNLINEHNDVLSVVGQEIGNGPFNLVVKGTLPFLDFLNTRSSVFISADQLILGDLIINTESAGLWPARPNWEILHVKREVILNRLASLPITNNQPLLPNSLLSDFSHALVNADLPSSILAAKQLAGLGQGLTPAGDDFILGALYASWIFHPASIAKLLAEEISNIAAPLTTSLSAAWLRSAGRGEAGILWHDFFDALMSENASKIQTCMDQILAVGETSGADALAGFVSVFSHSAEITRSKTS